MDLYRSNQSTFLELGFGLTQTGNRTLTMTETPVLNGRTLDEGFFYSVLTLLGDRNENIKESLLREKLMQTACKHAVKGGEPVEETEIRALLDAFLSGEVPLTCPHGRPVVVRITKTELEKMFRRIV
jgi:DNA mismatch repair protein MutL